MGERINQGYEIIQSIEVGSAEFVLGVNVKAPNPYVTWKCSGKDNYCWGHYMDSWLAATRDLCERALEEVAFLEQRHAGQKERSIHMKNRKGREDSWQR